MSRKSSPVKSATPRRAVDRDRPAGPGVAFTKVNAAWLGGGALAVIAGYVLLAAGSMTLAPVLLVAGYCVLLPIGIVKK